MIQIILLPECPAKQNAYFLKYSRNGQKRA